MTSQQPSPAEKAAARVTFQLTYARSPKPRRFRPGELTGPSIPCAYGGQLNASGDWENPDDGLPDLEDLHPDDPHYHRAMKVAARTETDWVDRYAGYALHEVVHEGLEWLRVDGIPWLDPHGEAEDGIYAAVDQLVDRLIAIRARHQPDAYPDEQP